MELKAVPLNKESHAKIRINQNGTVEHLRKMHMAPVNVFEFAEAAVEYPILFIKDKEEKFTPILMWGLTPEENLYIENDKWKGGFLPSILRFFPFVAHPTKEENQLALGIYEDAEIVNDTDGERVLDDNGEKSEWFSKIVESMHHVVAAEKTTIDAIKEIADIDLFIEQELKVVTPDNKESIIGGFHIIDSKKFFALSGDDLKTLNDKNLLGLIFSHFISLNNLKKVTSRLKKEEKK